MAFIAVKFRSTRKYSWTINNNFSHEFASGRDEKSAYDFPHFFLVSRQEKIFFDSTQCGAIVDVLRGLQELKFVVFLTELTEHESQLFYAQAVGGYKRRHAFQFLGFEMNAVASGKHFLIQLIIHHRKTTIGVLFDEKCIGL
jgi:hypothetical protein